MLQLIYRGSRDYGIASRPERFLFSTFSLCGWKWHPPGVRKRDFQKRNRPRWTAFLWRCYW